MAILINGNSGTTAEVEANSRALRVVQRPTNVGSNGAYRISVNTGTVAAGAAANSEFFQARWTSATKLCVVRKVRVGLTALTAFTAGVGEVNMMRSTSWSAAGTGGTDVAAPGTPIIGVRTSMPTSLFATGDMRVSTTAALGAGTKTFTSWMTNKINFTVNATANSAQLTGESPLYQPDPDEWPIILAQNEGISVRATVPATGTWVGHVSFYWEEVDSF